jgi:sirohydrochlorin cobaltochelatase
MLGVIVLAHGSRDPLWRRPVDAVAQQIRHADASAVVLCAYLELCEPDLATAARQMVERGVQRVRVLPLFFGMGKHAREDLPLLMADLARAHPDTVFDLLPTAGEDPRLIALLAKIALETTA